MNLMLHGAPWAAFCGIPGQSLAGPGPLNIDGRFGIRLVGHLPAGFRWNGSRPSAAARGPASVAPHWDLPHPMGSEMDQLHTAGWSSNNVKVGSECHRPRAHPNDRDRDDFERWLLWQVQRYNELSSWEPPVGGSGALECSVPGGARRTWQSVSELWQRGGEDTAELSLVVRLAKRRSFVHALRAIERNPRRMLFRRHANQRIDRIQEMDPTTLRSYSRAPGRTAIQKAGPRQELLAVVKQDTVDLVENRILHWVIEKVKAMADSYCDRNRIHRSQERYKSVDELRLLSSRVLASPRLAEVGPLPHHQSTPTYCLQFETRYRQVWRAYREIRRQERALDDAWRWHPRLWGSTARLILSSLLRNREGWCESRISTPYFRQEAICGEWTAGPSTPGPFYTPRGTCHVLEMREPWSTDAARILGIPPAIHNTGCDWVLCWPGESRCICLVWVAIPKDAGAAIAHGNELRSRIQALTEETGWNWNAWIALAEPSADPKDTEWVDSDERVSVIRFPARVHEYWNDLDAGVELALEQLDD